MVSAQCPLHTLTLEHQAKSHYCRYINNLMRSHSASTKSQQWPTKERISPSRSKLEIIGGNLRVRPKPDHQKCARAMAGHEQHASNAVVVFYPFIVDRNHCCFRQASFPSVLPAPRSALCNSVSSRPLPIGFKLLATHVRNPLPLRMPVRSPALYKSPTPATRPMPPQHHHAPAPVPPLQLCCCRHCAITRPT